MPRRGKKRRPPTWRPPSLSNRRPPNHVNAFIDQNGVPYLLAEYLDRTQFRQIDRSLIRSEIFIDQSESMRAVIDVNIDNIGRRADGLPKVQGNQTKQRRIIRMIHRHSRRLNNRLDVIRRGLVIRVNYQLENLRTRQVIRSASEHLRIRDRQYFIDINPRDISDNAIIVNFMDTLVSTLNQFTHGIDRMNIRITSIQLFYEVLSRRQDRKTGARMSVWNHQNHDEFLAEPDNDFNEWAHHNQFQNRHSFDIGAPVSCDCEQLSAGPASWFMFNRFYRFDNRGRDIILHESEIRDPNNRVRLLPCGTIHVNRGFLINPGHRIVFKFSIWKNDVTSFHNTQRIAHALGSQHFNHGPIPPITPPIWPPSLPPGRDALTMILTMLADKRATDKMQSKELARLRREIRRLQQQQGQEPTPPPEDCCPDYPDCDCGCDNNLPDYDCCEDYPDCDCSTNEPDPCCDCCENCPDCDCENCDCYDDPDPGPGDPDCCPECNCDPCNCDIDPITAEELINMWNRVFNP